MDRDSLLCCLKGRMTLLELEANVTLSFLLTERLLTLYVDVEGIVRVTVMSCLYVLQLENCSYDSSMV